jgi:hypothetical protein
MIKSRSLCWLLHVACTGDLINGYEVLIGISEEIRLLERHKRRWGDNIEMVSKDLLSLRDTCVSAYAPVVDFVNTIRNLGIFQRR